jgi:hypothetical protein
MGEYVATLVTVAILSLGMGVMIATSNITADCDKLGRVILEGHAYVCHKPFPDNGGTEVSP